MKWVVWILLLANLLLAGFFMGSEHWSQAVSGRTMPLNVDRLSLRSQTGPPAASPATPAQAPAVVAESMCVEWRGLSLKEVVQVRELLKTKAGEQAMSFTEVPLKTRHWVIFPPLPSPQSAAAKLSELAAAGVQDAFVVKEGAWKNAISLGLYANDEAAERRTREVESKGVLGTQVESLAQQGTDYYFVIRSENPDTLKSLSAIKQPYPNSQQSRVACPL